MLGSYLFATPGNGPYFTWLIVVFAALLVVGLAAAVVVRRGNYAAVRRRARRLRSITLWAAIPGLLYVLAREQQWGLFQKRYWLVIILAIFLGRLTWWLVNLRRLSTDKVEERQARRRQGYFRRARRRPRKPKRRR